jgi:hypothetical protein
MTFRVTEVEATYSPDGWPRPLKLRWDGETLLVTDVGRRWKTEAGIHVLARVPDERVFELHTNGALWRARVIAHPPPGVV